MSNRKLIVVESRFAGNIENNIKFARSVCQYIVRSGDNPYAMHIFYTQFLDDNVPGDRSAGIECGLQWSQFADEVWFCFKHGDFKMSSGMKLAYNRLVETDRMGIARFKVFMEDGTHYDMVQNEIDFSIQ